MIIIVQILITVVLYGCSPQPVIAKGISNKSASILPKQGVYACPGTKVNQGTRYQGDVIKESQEFYELDVPPFVYIDRCCQVCSGMTRAKFWSIENAIAYGPNGPTNGRIVCTCHAGTARREAASESFWSGDIADRRGNASPPPRPGGGDNSCSIKRYKKSRSGDASNVLFDHKNLKSPANLLLMWDIAYLTYTDEACRVYSRLKGKKVPPRYSDTCSLTCPKKCEGGSYVTNSDRYEYAFETAMASYGFQTAGCSQKASEMEVFYNPEAWVINDETFGIVIAYRGTDGSIGQMGDFYTDAKFAKCNFPYFERLTSGTFNDPEVHCGFLTDFKRNYNSIVGAVRRMQTKYQQKPRIYLTGHSLGGALATLMAAYMHTLRDSKSQLQFQISAVYTFGSPRVGNKDFAEVYRRVGANAKTFRVQHSRDPIPTVPLKSQGYVHVGRTIYLDMKSEKTVICQDFTDSPSKVPDTDGQFATVVTSILENFNFHSLYRQFIFMSCLSKESKRKWINGRRQGDVVDPYNFPYTFATCMSDTDCTSTKYPELKGPHFCNTHFKQTAFNKQILSGLAEKNYYLCQPKLGPGFDCWGDNQCLSKCLGYIPESKDGKLPELHGRCRN